MRLDSVKLDGSFFTPEGFIISEPCVTTCGIFEYTNPDGSMRRELRLPEHVFADGSLATYEGKPIVITHDAGRVDKDNTEEIVGAMISPGYRDGDSVRVKIVIHDTDAVKRSGLRELSLGYDLELLEESGVWRGEKYDAVQTDIRVNHLALVREARAGDQARLNIDGKNNNTPEGGRTMSAKTKGRGAAGGGNDAAAAYKERRRRRLDEGDDPLAEDEPEDDMPEGGGPAPGPGEYEPEDKFQLVKDRRDRRDQGGDPETPEDAMGMIAEMDEDIGTLIELVEELQAESDFAKAAPPEPEQEDEDEYEGGGDGEGVTLTIQMDSVDKIVRERLMLGRLGDRLRLDGLEAMRPIDAKKAIIRKVNPGMRLDGKSAAYVRAAFDAAVAQIEHGNADGADRQRRQMARRHDGAGAAQPGRTTASGSRDRMIERMMNGGKRT